MADVPIMSREFDRATSYAVSEARGRWWLDRTNPLGFKPEMVGPFKTQAEAEQMAARMNRRNRDA